MYQEANYEARYASDHCGRDLLESDSHTRVPESVFETQGARTDARRRNAIVPFHDDRDARHPAWYHDLCAHPDGNFGGIPMRDVNVQRA
jgi:hypothetical protein